MGWRNLLVHLNPDEDEQRRQMAIHSEAVNVMGEIQCREYTIEQIMCKQRIIKLYLDFFSISTYFQ
jgi:hypothetical protein